MGRTNPVAATSELPAGATMLNCPYADKNEVKALGAKWQPSLKVWYVPAGT